MAKKILVTGATGNIGLELLHNLKTQATKNEIIAAVRNQSSAKKSFSFYPDLNFRYFDFEDLDCFNKAFENIDCLFLLRPPHISDIHTYFDPLIAAAKKASIKEIVFLSVQGAEKSSIIPHHKVEKLIIESSIEHVFLRPSYFMQNLTTTLLHDIRTNDKIILPAGKAKFNWIDVKNIGEAAAILLSNFESYRNSEIELTGSELKNFYEISDLLSSILNKKISYKNINPISFYFLKRKEGLNPGFIIVIILLHFLPRFQKEPSLSPWYTKLTGKSPTLLSAFIKREQKLLTGD